MTDESKFISLEAYAQEVIKSFESLDEKKVQKPFFPKWVAGDKLAELSVDDCRKLRDEMLDLIRAARPNWDVVVLEDNNHFALSERPFADKNNIWQWFYLARS